ncbi:hypothetical protein CLF_109457 [Clonorchis sinensis]|uniref:Zinc finger PHD-type domain-containing protein n=1 Tax=Clonorchis sinensis TaxID=79923 RepID=G7YSM8_CLOSI|nr:hypothetical protein CLF_109457 [Clonorchis sinensis]
MTKVALALHVDVNCEHRRIPSAYVCFFEEFFRETKVLGQSRKHTDLHNELSVKKSCYDVDPYHTTESQCNVSLSTLHLVALMSLVNAGCSLQSSMVHNRCGRNGCPSNVRRGMQCPTCKAWWHFKCTGLQDDQVSQLSNSLDPFVCASCLYTKGAMHSQTKKKAIKNKTNSPLPNYTDRCKSSSLIDVLAAKLELLAKALTDANTKNAAIWTKVDKEISSLNEYPALSTPGPLAAKNVIQLSDAAIKTATVSLVDRRVRLVTPEVKQANTWAPRYPLLAVGRTEDLGSGCQRPNGKSNDQASI